MTQRIMAKNLLYTLVAVGTFGVCVTTSAMQKKVVTRAEDNYLPTAKTNLNNAQAVDQLNLTAIKSDIKRTERDLKLVSLDLDKDVVQEPIVVILPKQHVSLVDDLQDANQHAEQNDMRKKLTVKQAHLKVEQLAMQEEKHKAQARQLKANERKEKELAENQAKLESFYKNFNTSMNDIDQFELPIERPRKPRHNKKKPLVKSKSVESVLKLPSINFDGSDFLEYASSENTNNTTPVVTRSKNRYLSTAKQNRDNAQAVNQPNLTTIKQQIKKTEQKNLKVKQLTYDSSDRT